MLASREAPLAMAVLLCVYATESCEFAVPPRACPPFSAFLRLPPRSGYARSTLQKLRSPKFYEQASHGQTEPGREVGTLLFGVALPSHAPIPLQPKADLPPNLAEGKLHCPLTRRYHCNFLFSLGCKSFSSCAKGFLGAMFDETRTIKVDVIKPRAHSSIK